MTYVLWVFSISRRIFTQVTPYDVAATVSSQRVAGMGGA